MLICRRVWKWFNCPRSACTTATKERNGRGRFLSSRNIWMIWMRPSVQLEVHQTNNYGDHSLMIRSSDSWRFSIALDWKACMKICLKWKLIWLFPRSNWNWNLRWKSWRLDTSRKSETSFLWLWPSKVWVAHLTSTRPCRPATRKPLQWPTRRRMSFFWSCSDFQGLWLPGWW